MFAAVLFCFATDVYLEFTEVVVALGFRGRFVRVVGFLTFGSEFNATVSRWPFLGFSPWFVSIHMDMAAEFALASSLIEIPFSRDMLSANDNCA